MKLLGKSILLWEKEDGILADTVDDSELISTYWSNDCTAAVVPRECVSDEFFDLSTRLAGETLQKLTNYHLRIAFAGDFSGGSASLQDFMRECNKGTQVFFAKDVDEAVGLLSR